MKKVLLLLLVPAQIFIFSQPVWAVETPQFPSCTAPNGTILATYQDGTHGVPGDGTTYTGSDTVYKVDGDIVLQCLCPPNTSGIQTNWWRNPDVSENDMKVLQRDGWIYIPNGSLWGLDGVPYLAKNIAYNCSGRGGVLGKTTDGRVLGASTLAGTGATRTVLSLILFGTAMLYLARKIRPRSQ